MTPRIRRVLLALALGALSPLAASAHAPDAVVQRTTVRVGAGRLSLEYRTSYGPTLARLWTLRADGDGDGSLSPAETKAALLGHALEVTRNLAGTFDGRPLALVLVASAATAPEGHAPGDALEIVLGFESELPGLEAGGHALLLRDDNVPDTALEEMTWYVQAGPTTERLARSEDARALEWHFSDAPATGGAMGEVGPPRAAAGGAEGSTLERLVGEGDLTLGFVLVALLLAMGLGAVHALSPGHGKSLVAAYLVGSEGRVRDAVFLGVVVTLTHVSSVILLGVVTLFLLEHYLPQQIYPWLGVASGALVFVVGYAILVRMALGGRGRAHVHGPGGVHLHDPPPAHDHEHEHAQEHEHDSDHEHEHAHEHAHDNDHEHAQEHEHDHHDHEHVHDHEHDHGHDHPGRVTPWALLGLGISGGMIPCPSALVVLLIAVNLHRVGFGLLLIGAFSVGLALVLVLIGVLMVTAARHVRRLAGEASWVRRLPALSAGVIMLVGLAMVANALAQAGMLRL